MSGITANTNTPNIDEISDLIGHPFFLKPSKVIEFNKLITSENEYY